MNPGAQQTWIKQQLPIGLAAAGVPLAQKGTGAPDRIVMGVAEYSGDDLQMLDSVCAAASAIGVVLEVFLITDCKSQAEIEEYVPGVRTVFHSPVVGIWKAGSLTESSSGHAGRVLLRKELRLP